ncbi:discoidin domain-containing protein [Vallitalea maricola]|uniref:Uncharacterized protein n=1 Tax=Vallitalea maricola TaxID=3074433 RepID=A0ACB5URF2_9FIRM|nr:hypothetical protein AN2V17_43480 [Vallitalea sp. AN17-2]
MNKLKKFYKLNGVVLVSIIFLTVIFMSNNAFAVENNDVAQGKTATADSWQPISGRTADKGNDGDESTRWSASDGKWGHWWKVDLGASHTLNGCSIKWEFNKVYKYKIEVSPDDINWLMVADETNNTISKQIQTNDFNIDSIRYVRITITETENGCWASFYDFKVFGTNKFSEPIESTPYSNVNSNRSFLNFNTNWLYSNQDNENYKSITCDESRFTDVCLPHCNKLLNKHFDLDISQVQFISWYRRHFNVPEEYRERRVLIEFQGVSTVAEVYVNGSFVGEHKGAYTSFTYDITDYIDYGNVDNVIAVRVDSTERKDIPPEGLIDVDFFLFGGIYRDVNMIITDPVYVDWTFLRTVPLEDDSVMVAATTKVNNKSMVPKQCKVISNIVDADNYIVAIGESSHTIEAGSTHEFNNFTTRILEPDLWHPDDPNLYKVYTRVLIDDTDYVDEYITKTGLRWINFNKNDGKFYINGEYMKLRGTNRHETFPYIGRAAANRLQARDADIIKYEMGCNIVRCSHYPQDPEFLKRCDEIGLLVLEETPGWFNIGLSSWKDIVLDNIEEMIVRDRNHPSIIAWAVRINESIDDNSFYKNTNAKARSLDPTRPTTGSRFVANYLSAFYEDLFGYNDFTEGIKEPRVLPWLVTEYEGHKFPVKSFDNEDRLLENLLRHAKVQNEAQMRENVSGALGWCAFDYNTPLADSYSNNNIRYHGAFDMFRMPKHVAYFYLSQQSREHYGPVVYIANYWKENSPATVTVASNCDEVELFVNGISQGIKQPNLYTSLNHPLFEFKDIDYVSGEIRAEARINGEVVASHVRHTPGQPVKLLLKADDYTLIADGSDMTRVTVTALDEYDQIVPLSNNLVEFQVTGAGTFLGESPFILEDGKGGFFVKTILNETGTITCKATSDGLIESNISLSVVDMTEPVVPITDNGNGVIPEEGENIAFNRFVSSDSEQSGNRVYYINDDSFDTRWCANDWDANHWCTIDLGDTYNIQGTEVTWEKSDTVYKYKVEISSDKNNWITVVDKTDNSISDQIQKDDFVSNDVRYVKITITGLEKNAWASIRDFKVFK